jgi:hypothetical protein
MRWRKASRSTSNGEQCVEVARTESRSIAARDSKNPTGPILKYQRQEWHWFIEQVKAGEHDI